MSDRTHFWLGTAMLALAFGLLVGGLVMPRTLHSAALRRDVAIEGSGEGRTLRYALVTGLAGTARNTQTVFITDDTSDILFAFEYSSSAKKVKFRNAFDLRRFASKLSKERDG